MDRNAAGLPENFNSLILREISGKVYDHFIQIESISVCEEKVCVLEDIVKGQGKNEIKSEDTLKGKGLIERIGESKKSLKSQIQLVQEFEKKAEVLEETIKTLENILKGQGKHEIQDEGTSSGKGMVEIVGELKNDFHSLIKLSQCSNKEAEVWKEKVENMEMTRTRNEDAERHVEGFKVGEKLDKVVTRFLTRLPVFVGFLGVLYTKTFSCEMRKIFAFLIILSCMGLIFEGGQAIFQVWAIKVDNTKKKRGSQSRAITGLPLSGESQAGESTHDNNVGLVPSDIENGENCHQSSTFSSYAWPFVIEIIVILIFTLTFVLIIGKSSYTKKCVDSILPTPTPVSSNDMLFPIE